LTKNIPPPPDKNKDGFKHLSRHLHAKRRERGNGGRFLSKSELEKKALEDQELEELEREKNGEKPPDETSQLQKVEQK